MRQSPRAGHVRGQRSGRAAGRSDGPGRAPLVLLLLLGATAAHGAVPGPGTRQTGHHAHPGHHDQAVDARPSALIRHGQLHAPPTLRVDRTSRTVTLTAEATPGAFRTSSPPDHRYHALVSRSGGAAGKALMVTDTHDHEIAAALRSLGVYDGGGVPMSAWDHRALPFVPGPSSRVAGTRVEVLVTWEGAGETHRLGDLLDDPGGEGLEVRFGGNEEHDDHWPSGCILCLYSCPGGVLSNDRYTIRDHRRSHTSFDPGDTFPPDGTPVTITLQVVPN